MVGFKARLALYVVSLAILSQAKLLAAGSVTLAWDASPDASATGYRVYYGGASGVYTNSATVGNVTKVHRVASGASLAKLAAHAVTGEAISMRCRLAVSWAITFYALPLWGLAPSASASLGITACYFVVSFIRGWAIREAFRKWLS